jgi:hypothetical protein
VDSPTRCFCSIVLVDMFIPLSYAISKPGVRLGSGP